MHKKHIYHIALRLSIFPILLLLLSVSCKDPTDTETRTYTVTFEKNGGTNVKAQTVKEGEKVSKPDNPTRESHEFGGWYRDEALTQSFDFNTAITANITLYSKWNKTVFTVAFQTNGGTTVNSIITTKGNTIEKPDNPIKGSYGFGGWYLNKELTQSFAFTTPITADITLYAKWLKSVTVSFQTNGGTPSLMPITTVEGNTIGKPDSPTKENYGFFGWYLNKELTQPFFFNTPITVNTTLYAKWGEPVTVVFQTNGGTPVAPITIAKDNMIKRPDNPTKDGFILEGWYQDRKLTLAFFFLYPVRANITLYAKWGQPVTVAFQTNGGSPVKSITLAKDNTISEPDIPTKGNDGFGGWFRDENLTQPFDFKSPITVNTTLYAKWGQPVTVAFQTNGGSPVAPITTAKGNTIKAPTPTKGKLALLIWYRDENLTQAFDFTTPIINNITLYAKYGFWVPDENFRNKLKTVVPVAFNGEVMDTAHADVAKVSSMNLSYLEIKYLAGIEYFTKLTELDCSNNQLTQFNPAKNTMLTKLDCQINQLIDLDVTTNTKLTELYCSNNQLTQLNVATNTALTTLRCSNNKLTQLSVATNIALTGLYCYDNQLTQLNVATNTALTGLYCYDNQLTQLNVATNTALTGLYCYKNQLSKLDVTNNTKLTELYCYNNQLTQLNVATNIALTGLYCLNNQLSSLDVSKNTKLTELSCFSNLLSGLDVTNNTKLTRLFCQSNQLSSLDVSKNTALIGLDCSENKLTDLDLRGMNTLDGLTIKAGNNEKNLLTSMRVLDSGKNHDEIKKVKTTRGGNITITTYNNNRTTVTCNNYDPNQAKDEDTCLDP